VEGVGRRKRIRGKKADGGRRRGGNACYKNPYCFISAVAGGRKILIG